MRAVYLLSQEVILHCHEVLAVSALKSDSWHGDPRIPNIVVLSSRIRKYAGQQITHAFLRMRLPTHSFGWQVSTNRPLPGWQVRWQPNRFEKGRRPAKALACA